ncbi:MAG: DUF2804 family protein [Clostridiales bacterium]|nr:DUF2804 family protein [Clostridiales bacterium]
MADYPEYISEKRHLVPAPEKLVTGGKATFGTFSGPLPEINLLDSVKPCGKRMPAFMNKSRLTVWEAFEVSFKEGTIISAVYNMNAIGFGIFVFFDKRSGKVRRWFQLEPGKKCIVAENLLDSKTEIKNPDFDFTITNCFKDGYATAKGFGTDKKSGKFEIDMKITSVSSPSVVNIPFDENKSLYSQKELFSAEGYITVNGEKFVADADSAAIIDDHKGFYPFIAHYDWLTTMGKINHGGKQEYFGFNLTHNQSINQDDYNENLIWLGDRQFLLPPVEFEKNGPKWHISDAHGKVDVYFEIIDTYVMRVPVGGICIDYKLPFGKLSGYLCGYDGEKYQLDGMYGVGEDKTTRI